MTIAVDFSSLLTEPALVLAVSGGSDSLALMTLICEAHNSHNSKCRLAVATVDHGLRPESAAEANFVADYAACLGIEHHTLVWSGSKPMHGILTAAREARLDLLSGLAIQIGSRVVLVGHTADDLAETVLMRSARGQGIGLAGIAPATLIRNRVWFVRPLLAQRRGALQQILRERGQSWVEDPSNENDRFERVRIRKRLAERQSGAQLFEDAIAVAAQTATMRATLGREAAGLIARAARLDGAAIQCSQDVASAAQHVALHTLRLLIATAGRADHLPDMERSANMLKALRCGTGGTLSNAVLTVNTGGFSLSRDRRGHAGPCEPFRSPFSELLASFDVAPAEAIAHLLGQESPPAIPAT